jgi:type II secretory pathway pseudopilin PulG
MTLVEVLVLLALVSVLVAILPPAVRAARAAARAAGCVNNLRQLGLALHNYHSANDTLPLSQIRGDGHGNGHSAFMAILPFMEETRTYNAYNFSLENSDASNQTAVMTRITAYLCPDNPTVENVPAGEIRFPESRSTFARTHYGANWGGGRGPWGDDFVKTNGSYQGVMMTVITADGMVKGPDGRPRARTVSFKDITDGTSMTLAMIEKRDSFGWAVGGWGGSEFDAHTTPNYDVDDPLARKVYSGSSHAEGPSALMCDASVRSLTPRLDRAIWYALITRAGRDLVKFDE